MEHSVKQFRLELMQEAQTIWLTAADSQYQRKAKTLSDIVIFRMAMTFLWKSDSGFRERKHFPPSLCSIMVPAV